VKATHTSLLQRECVIGKSETRRRTVTAKQERREARRLRREAAQAKRRAIREWAQAKQAHEALDAEVGSIYRMAA
jgi:hypothetical protein